MKRHDMHTTGHARIYGSPGTRVRLMGLCRSLWPMILVLVLFGYLIRAALPTPVLSTTVTGLLFLVLAVAVAAAANYSRERLEKYIKGARGEESVARALALLPDGWHVFHGIASGGTRAAAAGGGADIDHVAVGPSGIFVIETKNWSGSITAEDGVLICDNAPPDRDPVEQVKHAVTELRQRLHAMGAHHTEDLPIRPILCFAGDCDLRNLSELDDVMICSEEHLCASMQSIREARLTSESRQVVIDLLEAEVER